MKAALAQAQAALGGGAVALAEARLLLGHVLGLERATLHRLGDRAPDAGEMARFEALVARRREGEPMSHLLGYRDFWACRFRVTPDVLDPRPETEALVAEALTAPFARVLDLGTGSGAILLSLLGERPAATGLGVDLSPAALAVAKGNAQALGLATRAEFALSDWFAAVPGHFDLIVANPPYIAEAEMPGLSPEVRHEPRMALTPGGDGLAAYRAIAAGAPAHLTPGGRVLLEIGPTQGAAVCALLAAAGFCASGPPSRHHPVTAIEVRQHPDRDQPGRRYAFFATFA